ncbi:hematopoietic prostaglandin D synthase-like [Tubulanus polymorphus]|uniref:hematopoietic prostaglandin D synthase-like n=1 Tax=Tubulanus polymorphus TaxID=672921 RepID=UPI003DA1FB69
MREFTNNDKMNMILEPRQHNHHVFTPASNTLNGTLVATDRQKHRKMPTKYRLLYFNARGRAELARLIFAAADVDYEDFRFEKEEWPAIKPTLHFGQVPILEVDGKQINQTYAIARFIATEHGLSGRNRIEAAQVDALVDTLEDMMKPIQIIYSEENNEKRVSLIKSRQTQYMPSTLLSPPELYQTYPRMSATRYLQKNIFQLMGYLVGDDLTWADLSYINCCSWLCLFVPNALDKYPKLRALKDKIEGLPRIAKWLANRPQTDY